MARPAAGAQDPGNGVASFAADNLLPGSGCLHQHHGMPTVIVSDRFSRFTSNFWQSLMKPLGTKLSLSTAFHPLTDGQLEVAERSIEQMLRAFAGGRHEHWDKHLDMIEVAYQVASSETAGSSR